MAAESASGVPLELIGLVTPLPADGGPVPGEIVEHEAHALGHAAVLLADRGVLIAGDMLSDVLIQMLDPRRPGQVEAYETALDRLDGPPQHVDVLVPGHGASPEVPPGRRMRQAAATLSRGRSRPGGRGAGLVDVAAAEAQQRARARVQRRHVLDQEQREHVVAGRDQPLQPAVQGGRCRRRGRSPR